MGMGRQIIVRLGPDTMVILAGRRGRIEADQRAGTVAEPMQRRTADRHCDVGRAGWKKARGQVLPLTFGISPTGVQQHRRSTALTS